MNALWWKFGALSLSVSVGLDAFGYHVLSKKRTLDVHERERWRIGTFYQFIHSLSIMFLSTRDLSNINTINGVFTLGMALFSGSLYGITITKKTKLGHITPFGGITLMIGWVMTSLAVSEYFL